MSTMHLVKRFIGSLWPLGPRRAENEWAESHLIEREVELWNRMSRQDRRHSIGVALRVEDHLVERATRPVLAAALLHDVGKIDSHLGTFLRVVATLSAAVAGRETAELWVRSTGVTRRIGLYLKHPSIGGDLLGMAGSDALTETWAREHHLPAEECSLDHEVAHALRVADDD
ncbi:MAG: hypothetical protein ACI81L_002377 [Verrucomicrobiales bacterium]|jgi:hypothetical protein